MDRLVEACCCECLLYLSINPNKYKLSVCVFQRKLSSLYYNRNNSVMAELAVAASFVRVKIKELCAITRMSQQYYLNEHE